MRISEQEALDLFLKTPLDELCAMANAKKEVREKADYIAPSCDEDGLVDVIHRFIKDW